VKGDRFSKRVAMVMGLAVLVRLVVLVPVLLDPSLARQADSGSYLGTAANLLAGNGFSQRPAPPYVPYLFRTPAYPVLIAAVWALFGRSLSAVVVFQAGLDLLTCLLVCRIGRRVFGRQAGLLGGVLYAVSMVSVAHVAYLASETLFVFLIACLAGVLLSLRRDLPGAVAAGGLWGLATLCRPIALLLLPPLAVAMGWPSGKRSLLRGVALVLAGMLVVGPWFARNHSVSGRWMLATVSDYNLLAYGAAAVEASRRGVSQAQARADLLAEVASDLRASAETGPGAQVDLYRSRSREIFLADPWRTVAVHLRGDLNSLLPAVPDVLQAMGITRGGMGTLDVLNQDGLVAAIDHYFRNRRGVIVIMLPWISLWVGTLGLAALGCARLLRSRRWLELLVLGGMAAYFVGIPVAASTPRFSAPAAPLWALLGGWGWAWFWKGGWKCHEPGMPVPPSPASPVPAPPEGPETPSVPVDLSERKHPTRAGRAGPTPHRRRRGR
jgi:4-amino-4-deoxy-L-arabinose transferase-like glycosyltransferase